MDAKSLVNAMIAEFIQATDWQHELDDVREAGRRTGMFDMIVHAAMVAHGTSPTVAREYVAEEIRERIAAMA